MDKNSYEQKIQKFEEKLLREYPVEYPKVKQYYEDIFKTNFIEKPSEEINDFFVVIKDYENFLFNYTYKADDKNIYNINNIYTSYSKKINKKVINFIRILIYFFVNGWINIFIPKNDLDYFTKSNESVSIIRDTITQLYAIEDICEIYRIIKNNEDKSATIYFTYDGYKIYENNVRQFLLKKLEKSQEELKKEQKKLEDKINNYNIQIITIVSITISIVTFIAVNIKELGSTPLNFLLIDGSLIVCITTIFFIIGVVFFEINKKYWFLIVPLIIGIILIYGSLHYL